MKPLVSDGDVYKLISSLLCLPIIDDHGNHRSDSCISGIPPVGEITRVLFNIVLMDIFDREFAIRFPGRASRIASSRFSVMFISTSRYDEGFFDDQAGYTIRYWKNSVWLVSIGPVL